MRMQRDKIPSTPYWIKDDSSKSIISRILADQSKNFEDKQLSDSNPKVVNVNNALSSASKAETILFPNGDEESRCCKFHYFHLFFTFSFYLFVTPFRPVLIQDHYKLSKKVLQKVLCLASWIFVLYRQFIIIRTTWESQTIYRHLTLFYFYIAHSISHGVLTCTFYWIFHSKLISLEIMLEKIAHSCLLANSSRGKNKVWYGVLLLHIVSPVLGLISPVAGYNIIDTWCWTPSTLFRAFVPHARYAFFMGNISQLGSIPDATEVSPFDSILTSLCIIIFGLYELHLHLMSLLFGICVLTLWTAATRFQNLVKSLSQSDLVREDPQKMREVVMFLYYELKDLSDGLNDIWGLFCFWYVIDIIPFQATDLDSGLRGKEWFDAVKMFRSILFLGWNLFLSGDTFRIAQWFHAWLLERQNRHLFVGHTHNIMDDMELLLHELELQPIGMGAAGFYRINYAFVGQIYTTIITFFIITLQYATDQSKVRGCGGG